LMHVPLLPRNVEDVVGVSRNSGGDPTPSAIKMAAAVRADVRCA